MTVVAVERTWHEVLLDTLKANNVRLVTYVPDRVLTPLINALQNDSSITSFTSLSI